MPGANFDPNTTYRNCYFLFVDAAGYSTIVGSNPLDLSYRSFDLFLDRVKNRVQTTAERHRCARAVLWSWRGDGGFFVIHDDNDSVGRDAALEAGKSLLRLDLRHIQDEFREIGTSGELHIRTSVHRGMFHYTEDGGAPHFHSADVNFTAHLEKAAPRDSLVISEEVFQISGRHAEDFELAGSHEGRKVYILASSNGSGRARRSWLVRHGPADWVPVNAFPERPDQQTKTELVNLASAHLLDIGTALNTCSQYLMTTERPAWYRTAVLDLLDRGGIYQCILLDPKSAAAGDLSSQRDEDIPVKIARSLQRFADFKERYGDRASNFLVYQTRAYAGFHALAVDLATPDSMILYSPYFAYTLPLPRRIERGDMPHYFVGQQAGPVFAKIRDLVQAYCDPESLQRLL